MDQSDQNSPADSERAPEFKLSADTAAEIERQIIVETLHWRGMAIRVAFEPVLLGVIVNGRGTAIISIETLEPPLAPLPLTPTGYRTEAYPLGSVEAQGGPLALVARELDRSAQSKSWRASEASRNRAAQLDLF